jgi:hypothetical protein
MGVHLRHLAPQHVVVAQGGVEGHARLHELRVDVVVAAGDELAAAAVVEVVAEQEDLRRPPGHDLGGHGLLVGAARARVPHERQADLAGTRLGRRRQGEEERRRPGPRAGEAEPRPRT